MAKDVRLIFAFALSLGACRCGPKHEASLAVGTSVGTSSAMTRPAPSKEAAAEVDACPAIVAETRTGGSRSGLYVEPSEEERRIVRAAMAKLLLNEPDANFGGAEFERVEIPEWPDAVLIRERPDHRRGGGAYIVRPSSRSSLVVQAPHTFYDEGTFPLACELFRRSGARALFFNTSHRYRSAPATPDGHHPADVAHSPTSMFHAMTEGLVDAVPRPNVLQLHGFQNRESPARAVVSSGENVAGAPLVARAASAFEAVVGGRVARYPEDASELGATTNVQGMLVRRAGGRFLHVEMEQALRRELLADAALRARALDALAGVMNAP